MVRSRASLVTLTVALAACGGGRLLPTPVIRPTVRLHHLSVRNLGLAGGTLDLVLAFYNPNRFAIRGTRLNAGLDIEATHFGDVALTEAFELVVRDTSLVSVPLTFQWSGLAAAARSLLNYGAVNYRMTGTVFVDAPLGHVLEVPFSGEGNVPLLRGGGP